MTNVIAGVALFVAGAVVALVWTHWDKIMLYLKLRDSGAIDAGQQLAAGIQGLFGSIKKSM